MTLRVYVGYDAREADAYRVAVSSLRRRASGNVMVTPLVLERLRAQGLLTRMVDARGQLYDLPSQAPQATEFKKITFPDFSAKSYMGTSK